MTRRDFAAHAGIDRGPTGARLPRGVITIYTCVMVLILMATILTYSTYTSMAEQKESANELRQKQAFHAAQAGIELASEWFRAHSLLINVDVENILGDLDGFLYPGAERWMQCASVNYSNNKSHPCWGDPNDARRPYVYFYNHNGGPAPSSPRAAMAASGPSTAAACRFRPPCHRG